MATDACRIEAGRVLEEPSPLLSQVQSIRDEQLRSAAAKEFPGNERLQDLSTQAATADGTPQHPKLGCYDQLSLDAARAYPGDPTLQRAAVEEKMGPSNFTYDQRKLMEAYREFPDNKELQDIAVRDVKNRYFKEGEPISSDEKEKLDAARDDHEAEDRIKSFMPQAAKQFDDPRLQHLEAMHLAQNSMGKLLMTMPEAAELAGGRQFPHNPELQKLAAKEILAQTPENPQLTSDEKAKLTAERYQTEARREFPNDPELQRIATKARVAQIEGQPQLNTQERASLDSIRTFPNDAVSRQLLMDEMNGKSLSPEQKLRLTKAFAEKEFPDQPDAQAAAVKEQLWLQNTPGAEGLSREDYIILRQARQMKMMNMMLSVSRLLE